MTLSEAVQQHCSRHPKADYLRQYLESMLVIHQLVQLRGEELVRIPVNLDPEAPVPPEDLEISLDRPEIDPEKLRKFLDKRDRKIANIQSFHFQIEQFLLGLRRTCVNLSDDAVREFLLSPLSPAPRTLDDKNNPKSIFRADLSTVSEGLESLLCELEETIQKIRENDMKVKLSTLPEAEEFLLAQRKILQSFRHFLRDLSKVE